MTRTTPPRPVDIAELFPALRAHSTTATRLHPRPGSPTTAGSSVGLLPEELDAQITAWEEEGADDDGDGPSYQHDLSLAPGWKVGGFASWSLSDPQPMNCAECGTAMTLLFTAASSEWDGTDGSWRPVEEPASAPSDPTDVSIGRGYALYVFRCPASFDHPPATAMQ